MTDTMAEIGRSDDDTSEADEGLTPEQTRFVEAIAEGQSVADAAKAADRSPRTGRRWKVEPAVAAAIRDRLTEAMAQARAVLAAGASRAARALVSMAGGESPAESARVSACRAVTEGATKLIEIEELQARLADLEARLGEQLNRFPFRS